MNAANGLYLQKPFYWLKPEKWGAGMLTNPANARPSISRWFACERDAVLLSFALLILVGYWSTGKLKNP